MVTYTNQTISSLLGNGASSSSDTLNNSTVTGNANLGGGNDNLFLNGSDVNGVVLSGEGDDRLVLDATSSINGIQASSGDSVVMAGGNDTFIMSGTATVAGGVYMSSGNDAVTITGGTVGGDVDANYDNDTVNISNASIGGAVVGGQGTDNITLSNVTLTGNIYGDMISASAVGGNDVINLSNITTSGTIFGNENADSVNITSLASSLTVDGSETSSGTGLDNDTLNLSALTGTIVYDTANAENGVFTEDGTGKTITFSNIENVVPPIAPVCFTSGMAIETVDGEKMVEDLAIGDLVMTYDNGLQPIRFIYKRSFSLDPHSTPVCFERGAIGNNRKLIVSQKHSIFTKTLPKDLIQNHLGDEEDNLLHACHLINGSTIRLDYSKKTVTYYHIMFNKHELIKCHGIWSESWHPIRRALHKDKAIKKEILRFFPEIRNQTLDNTPPVRTLSTRYYAYVN